MKCGKLPKEKKCAVCPQKFIPQRLEKYCSYVCALKAAREKLAKEKATKWNEQKKVMKEKLKTLGDYEKEARVVFQKWIRKRDETLPCISCGDGKTDKWDAGHMLKAELYSGLIFNEDNVHKQCKRCNNWLGGNEINYRIGLIQRIGKERVEYLESIKDQNRVYKYSKQQLIDIKNTYKEKLKEYAKNT